jgi:hypothetical protein
MFVQVIQGHVAERDELKDAFEQWQRELSPGATGFLGSTGGITDDGMFIGLARFESADAARHNSERPEQHQWWMETAKLFAGDVHFHDCRDVVEFGQGGSDDAGFVQCIQGRTDEPERVRHLMDGIEPQLRQLRPDVIGGLVAMHGDSSGGFTQAVYFTSEQAAREGERKEPPPEVAAAMQEQMSLLRDVTYLDLKQPWLWSPGR